MPDAPGNGTPAPLTGGPDREYRSGEIEPSQVIQPHVHDGDWEEKTVVDDGQLYNTKEGPNTLSIGTTTSDDELTIDEPSKAMATGLGRTLGPGRPVPAVARPAAPARPPITTPANQVPEAAQGKLVVIAGNDAGREYPLLGKPITVGRGIDNDVVLTDIAVSRKHMTIAFDGNRYQLSDKGSGNGTIINQRVETGTRVLSHGDRIEIGNTVFRFEHPASEKESWAGNAQRPPAPPVPTGAGTAPPPPSPALPLPASPPRAASEDSGGLPLPPRHLAPPSTITGSSPVGDLALEGPQPESAPLPETPSPWSPPPVASPVVPPAVVPVAPPMVAPALASGIAAVPANAPAFPVGTPASFVPLVPHGPITGPKLLVGTAATFVALIGIAIAGMLIGGDQSLAGQTMEPPVSVEEMLLPLLEPLLELGAGPTDAPAALPPGDAVPDVPSSAEPEPAGTETP